MADEAFRPAAPPAFDAWAEAESALAALEECLGVVLVVHDPGRCLQRPAEEAGQPPFRFERHRHPYCDLQRDGMAGWNRRCLAHCGQRVHEEVRSAGGPLVHRCWKGAAEVVVPLARGDVLMAVAFAGVFRLPGAEPPAGLPPQVRAAWRRLPVLDGERAERCARLAGPLLDGLLQRLEGAAAGGGDRATVVRRFLRDNLGRPLRLAGLARLLGLSPSRAGHAVSEICGAPFRRLLREERIRHAAFLLGHSRLGLRDIACRCGFADEYHFSRAFRRQHGVPPGRWRRQRSGV